jgi:N-methylhydantoinase B
VFRIFARNSRFPDILKGDLRAIWRLRWASSALRAYLRVFGMATTLAAFEQIIQQSTAAVRQTLRRVPMVYSFRDYLDSDGITDQSYAVH